MPSVLTNYLRSYTDFSPEEVRKVLPYWQPTHYPAGTTLLEEGQVCRHLYFLEAGLVRFYSWEDGQDISKYFTEPPYCFTSQRSMSLQLPAEESIECLEDSLIWKMKSETAFQLMKELPAWNSFILKLVQEVQYFTELLLLDNQKKTAEERYRLLLTTNGELLQRVPLRMLASFLGIAPQSLSRIRKKMSQADRT